MTQDVDAILKISLVGGHHEDMLIWGKIDNDIFSVRCTYWLAEEKWRLHEEIWELVAET